MAQASDVIELTEALIARASVTPDDAGCQALVAERLCEYGFAIESLRYGDVDNLWATHGSGAPVFCFLGHTDVVPPGPREQWQSDPFKPSRRGGNLYGRGSADMKGSVAACVCALESLVRDRPDHPGTLALLLTSDEEGPSVDGVRRVVETFRARGQGIDYCLVGEPSSLEILGDGVRIGRRGSLTASVRVRGLQGHVAYPERVVNPIHRVLPWMSALTSRQWDVERWPDFPQTSLQFVEIHAGVGANNVVPGELNLVLNLRYSPRWTPETLREEIESSALQAGLDARFEWHYSGGPFHTQPGRLRAAVRESLAGQGLGPADENTGGGTSDGRFVATLGAEVVELGPINASIHQVDEHVAIADLERLPSLYAGIAMRILQFEQDR